MFDIPFSAKLIFLIPLMSDESIEKQIKTSLHFPQTPKFFPFARKILRSLQIYPLSTSTPSLSQQPTHI